MLEYEDRSAIYRCKGQVSAADSAVSLSSFELQLPLQLKMLTAEWLTLHSSSRIGACALPYLCSNRIPRFIFEEQHMADDLTSKGLKNEAEGIAKQAEGKTRNAVGGITGDSSEQLKGKAKDLEGEAQRKIGEKEVDLDN